MDYPAYEAMTEASNYGACHAAFSKAHPLEALDASELCDAGSWSCPDCPWKETAHLHSFVLNQSQE